METKNKFHEKLIIWSFIAVASLILSIAIPIKNSINGQNDRSLKQTQTTKVVENNLVNNTNSGTSKLPDKQNPEFDVLRYVKSSKGLGSITLQQIYDKETEPDAVTPYGWFLVANPKGGGWFVGYKTETASLASLPIWWIKEDKTIYWVNGKASSRSNKAYPQMPYNASGMSTDAIYDLAITQRFE